MIDEMDRQPFAPPRESFFETPEASPTQQEKSGSKVTGDDTLTGTQSKSKQNNTHQGASNQSYACDICPEGQKSFSTKKGLTNHQRAGKCKPQRETSIRKSVSSDVDSGHSSTHQSLSIADPEYPFACKVCPDRVFKRKNHLDTHIRANKCSPEGTLSQKNSQRKTTKK